jgi:hypothetical protein
MSKAYLFLRKLITLCINVLILLIVSRYPIPFYYSLPVLILIFSLISSRILGESPKELYNFKRSETYFARGGLRDLLRIPVVLFAFLHDMIVWELWGIYQLLQMLVDCVYFLKELVFWILHCIIWFLKQLLPFWRVLSKVVVFYLIKWPWWIYRYGFKSLKKTYNWNIIRISFPGSLLALIIVQFFYFLDVSLNISGLLYIGVILAILPIAWVFGEIASVRGQKLLKENFSTIKLRFGNGMETVRGVLFFLTFLVVLLLAEAGLDLLGWLPQNGIIFLGIGLNLSFIINILVIFLALLVVLGSLVLPSYRLYNEFSETRMKDVLGLFNYIVKRLLQIIAGFIPASFFAVISAVLPALLLVISLSLTLKLKDNIIDIKKDKVLNEQLKEEDPLKKHKLDKQLENLNYIRQFPQLLITEMQNRDAINREIEYSKRELQGLKEELAGFKNSVNLQITDLEKQIAEEKQKAAINETRVEELKNKSEQLKRQLELDSKSKTGDITQTTMDIEFAQHKFRQIPFVFYLSGLFAAITSSLIFVFIFGYFGNFFYAAFVCRNDGTPAQWKEFIKEEQRLDNKHPLLSTSLNVIILLGVSVFFYFQKILEYVLTFFNY